MYCGNCGLQLYFGTERLPNMSDYKPFIPAPSVSSFEDDGASQDHAALYRPYGNGGQSRPRLPTPQDDANARTFGTFMASLVFRKGKK
jgi:hypothetical protein